MAVMSGTVDRPEYSSVIIAMSAEDEGLAVIVAAAPPLAIGAVQMLISVLSDAVKCVTSTNGSLRESVTEVVVAVVDFQIATSTTSPSPAVTLAPVVTAILAFPDPCALTCCTNAGTVTALAAGAAMPAVAPLASNARAHAAAAARYRRPRARARVIVVLPNI